MMWPWMSLSQYSIHRTLEGSGRVCTSCCWSSYPSLTKILNWIHLGEPRLKKKKSLQQMNKGCYCWPRWLSARRLAVPEPKKKRMTQMTNDCYCSMRWLSARTLAELGPKKMMMKKRKVNDCCLLSLSLWWLSAHKLAVPAPKKIQMRHCYYSKAI